MYSKDSGYSN